MWKVSSSEDGNQLKQKNQGGGDREKEKKTIMNIFRRDKTIAAPMKQEQVTINKEYLKRKNKLLEIKNMGADVHESKQ